MAGFAEPKKGYQVRTRQKGYQVRSLRVRVRVRLVSSGLRN